MVPGLTTAGPRTWQFRTYVNQNGASVTGSATATFDRETHDGGRIDAAANHVRRWHTSAASSPRWRRLTSCS